MENCDGTDTLSTCPITVGFKPAIHGSTFCITVNFDVIVKKVTMIYDIKKLTAGMMQTVMGTINLFVLKR